MNKFENETMYGEIVTPKPKTFLGIIGALIGALIGGAMWAGLNQLDVIAGFAGIAIIYLSCKGYALLSKSTALKGVIISITISVIVLVATQFLCWGVDIYFAFIDEYDITLLEAILSVPSIAFTADYVVDFIKEMLIGLILIGAGSAQFIRQANQSSNTEAAGNKEV